MHFDFNKFLVSQINTLPDTLMMYRLYDFFGCRDLHFRAMLGRDIRDFCD